MPTIVYLDPDDEIASIKSKLEAAGDEAVEIQVPYGLRALQNPVKVRLLRRHLESLGIRATIVSRDDTVRNLLRAEGLRVEERSSSRPALLAPEVVRSPKSFAAYVEERGARSAHLRMWKALGMGGLGVAVLFPVLGAVVFLPSATVVLRTEVRPIDEVVQVTASSLATSIDPVSLRVPARIQEVDFQATSELDTVGVRKDPERRARGNVTLVNRTDAPVDVPAGTRVGTSSGVVFLTQRAVLVPPDQPSGVQVAVAAANPGGDANAGGRQVTRMLDPYLSGRVTVSNEQAMEGGSDNETRIVGEEDYWALRERVLVAAREEVLRRLEELRKPEVSYYSESLRLRITGEEMSPSVGQQATQVTLTMQGKGRILSFSGREVNEMLRRHFDRRDPAYELSQGILEPRVLESVNFDNDNIVFRMKIVGTLRLRLDEGQVKVLVQGKSRRDVQVLLGEQFPLVAPPQVQFSPFWVDTVPLLPWRITVRQLPVR